MNYALLLLAGSSTRFKNSIPKQFFLVNKKPVFFYPLCTLSKSKAINQIVLVVPKNQIVNIKKFVTRNKIIKVKHIIAGGKTRNESVKNGLNAIKNHAKANDIILIHDAARPLLGKEDIALAIKETKKNGATTFAYRCYDTMIKINSKYVIKEYLNRDEVFALQTPQTFKYEIIKEAYKTIQKSNDDTELVHRLHKSVHLLNGSDKLFKITNAQDINKLKSYLK